MELVARVEQLIKSENLFQPGDSIVVGVSGGPDSTALLHILFLLSRKWDWRLVAAHVHHGFRPEESEEEARFVQRFAESLPVPFVMERIDVPTRVAEQGGNPQQVARELRYAFMLRVAREHGCASIALAHHADDQAETVLMRLLRGAGSTGLAGMVLKRSFKGVDLVRPLLRTTKAEILDHLHRHQIRYCVDSSNLSTKYLRNRIRLEALPYLARYNPELPLSLNRLAEMMAAENEFMEQQAEEAARQIIRLENKAAVFSREAFCRLHLALQRRMIKLILNYLSLGTHDFADVERIRTAIADHKHTTVTLPVGGKVRLIREYDRIRIVHDDAAEEAIVDYAYTLARSSGSLSIPEAGCTLIAELVPVEDGGVSQPIRSNHAAEFDADRLQFPLTVRNRRNGDRMRLHGLNGTKKVKDIFIDEKIPPSQRNRIPIVTDAEGTVIWIPGVRRSDHALPDEYTSCRYVLRLSGCDDPYGS